MSPQAAADDGFTLVELLVSISLMLIVMGIAMNGVIVGMQHQRRQVAQIDALNRTTIALERTTKFVRGADPIVAGDAAGIQVTLPDGGATVQRSFRLASSGPGTQSLLACNGVLAACVTGGGSVLLDNVTNDAAQPLFTYLDKNGTVLATPLSATDVPKAKTVVIHPRVTFPEATGPIEISNDVQVRNWSE